MSGEKAMLLYSVRSPLREAELPPLTPSDHQILVQVLACGVCRTDLHVVDGELPGPKLPLVPGHEIVGMVADRGRAAEGFDIGARVGIPWLGHTCGVCPYCLSDRENLCDSPLFTGYTLDGGYAEYALADSRYCLPIPASYSDANAAPLLCAGLIGYRSLRKAGEGRKLGLYGFGAAAHIIVQVARQQGRDVYAFTRSGDTETQRFALEMGAVWAGPSDGAPPEELDAAIIFAPVGALAPEALKAVRKGGRVVCGGIHMSDIPSFPYRFLWGEREISSVANLTRRDGEEFMSLASRMIIRTEVETYPLGQANEALERLRTGRVRGAAVLVPEATRLA